MSVEKKKKKKKMQEGQANNEKTGAQAEGKKLKPGRGHVISLMILLQLAVAAILLVEARPSAEAGSGQQQQLVGGGGGGRTSVLDAEAASLRRETVARAKRQAKKNNKKGGKKQLEIECLAAHNKFRRHHKVPDLQWDDKLAAFAQKRSDHIAASDGAAFGHPPDLPYGENLFWHSSIETACDYMIRGWYDEIKLYNFASPTFAAETGHFTQVIWRDTKRVGCAVTNSLGKRGGVYLTCSYDPAGNFLGEFVENVPRPSASVAITTTTRAPAITTTATALSSTTTTTSTPTTITAQAATTTKPKSKKKKKKNKKKKNNNKNKKKNNNEKDKNKNKNKNKKSQKKKNDALVSGPESQQLAGLASRVDGTALATAPATATTTTSSPARS